VDTTEEWRRNGLRLQLVSRWILPRLGLRIIKAQEDPVTPALEPKLRGLSDYLKTYSDYIVSKRGRLQIVEVKAPVVFRGLKRPFGVQPVEFSRHQMHDFPVSPVPVKVLLWDYGSAHSLLELRSRVFYALTDFSDFDVVETLADTVKMRLRGPQRMRPRWISAGTLRHLAEKSEAMRVREIKPGCIVRDLFPT